MKKIWLKLKEVLLLIWGSEKKVEKYLLDHADEGINVFMFVKKFVDSPALDVLKAFTPDNIDAFIDKNREKIKNVLSIVIDKLGLSKACLAITDFNEKFACFVTALKDFTLDAQEGLIYKGAALYAKISSGQNIKQSLADTAVQMKIAERKIDLGSWTAAA